jgi:hypothetical protein
MADLRRYAIVFLTIGIALSWTTGALAGKVFLRYDNGTVVEKWSEIKDDVETPSADAASIITLDVWEEIKDADTRDPVSEVYPGQEVILYCYFNRLDSLEVPFKQLIGREITAYYILFGALKYKYNWSLTIEHDHGGLVGMGVYYTVPNDVPTGKFLYFTLATISGLKANNNRDWGIYSIVE